MGLYGESASIEEILLKFAKYTLEVLLNNSNSAVLGELSLYPVWVSTKLKVVKIWNRICEGNASVLVEDAPILFRSLASFGKDSWFKNLSAVVEDIGLLVKNIDLPYWEIYRNLEISLDRHLNQEMEGTYPVHIIS